MGVANGALTLHWDSELGVAWVAGKGDSSVAMFETDCAQGKIFALDAYRSAAPQAGVCFLPKSVVNVREVEICRMLKLHADKVEAVPFYVPRQRKEFFQDDLYVPTRDWSAAPLASAAQWLDPAVAPQVATVTLQPAGMTPLSAAPAQEKAKKPASAYFLAQAEAERAASTTTSGIQDSLFQKVKAKDDVVIEKPNANNEVADDEWD